MLTPTGLDADRLRLHLTETEDALYSHIGAKYVAGGFSVDPKLLLMYGRQWLQDRRGEIKKHICGSDIIRAAVSGGAEFEIAVAVALLLKEIARLNIPDNCLVVAALVTHEIATDTLASWCGECWLDPSNS